MESFEKTEEKFKIYSDGERQAPTSLVEAEPSHLARYKFVLNFISRNDIVLDAPCGSGYGVKLISSQAKEAKGVDINEGAILHAKNFFSNPNNSFLKGNIENMRDILPESGVFDVVTSFEGIEHIEDPQMFLGEIQRLLKKEGKLIISTPRKPHGSPFHITEYSLDEYISLLSQKFKVEQMYG